MAHDGNVVCVHPAPGLHELAEFLLPDEIPGERNLVLQREPVVQVQVATPAALAAAETGRLSSCCKLAFGRAEEPLRGCEINTGIIEEPESCVAEDMDVRGEGCGRRVP